MDCRELYSQLDDYLDERLDAAAAAGLRDHLQRCPRCRLLCERETALRVALRSLPAPEPRADFVERALARAAGARAAKRWWQRPVPALALAATLVLGVALGMLLNPRPAEAPVPVVSLALERPETVRLRFNAASALTGVTVSLRLPENVELVGYAGRRELVWQTDLRQGGNLLQLPLVAHGPVQGELVAQLAHGDSRKTFRIQVQAQAAGATRLPAPRLAT